MRKLIEYISSCFCKHEWELLNQSALYDDRDIFGKKVDAHIIGHKWTYRCKKCGYCKTYKDF